MIIKILINGQIAAVSDPHVFRRVLNAARHNLTVLEAHEAYTMPLVDKNALAFIENLQFDHKELM